jgi:uncharacterized 2Fe-2S/4Fe-4S cluster protein (DUF4445 family)
MRRVGILDSRGKFKRGVESNRVREREGSMEYVLAWAGETAIGKDIITTQKDVRQIQLAKAALYVAARTLLRECGLELPDKILLAGGFGSSINPASAMRLGMIPALPLENVFTAGNAAGDGARITLLNLDKRREAAEVARQVTRYELPTDPAFQQQFMHALGFPEIDL